MNRFLMAAVCLFSATPIFAETLKEKLDFVSDSYKSLSKQGLSLEEGTIKTATADRKKATWVYQGNKGAPETNLDLFLTSGGKAKTHAEAQKACENLYPPKEWRLGLLGDALFFGENVLKPLQTKAEATKNIHLFWAASGDKEEAKKQASGDSFYVAIDGDGGFPTLQSYSEMMKEMAERETGAETEEEKEHYADLLQKLREGVQVLCVAGHPEI